MRRTRPDTTSGEWWELAAGNWLATGIDAVRILVMGNVLNGVSLGYVGVFGLVASLANYTSLGMRSVAVREYVHHTLAGDDRLAERNRDLCLSIDASVLGIVTLVVPVVVFAIAPPATVVLFSLLGALAYSLGGTVNLLGTQALIDQRYRAAAQAKLLESLFFAVSGLLLVVILGAPGIPIASLASTILVIAFYFRVAPPRFRLTLDWQGASPLVKKGASLSLSTITIGANLSLLRIYIIGLVGLEAFGLFTLAYGFVNRVNAFLLSLVNADSRRFFEDLARPEANTRRLWSRFAVMAALGGTCSLVFWWAFPWFMQTFIPRHAGVSAAGQILGLIILPMCVGSYAGLAVVSVTVDTPSALWITRVVQIALLGLAAAGLAAADAVSLESLSWAYVASEYFYHSVLVGWTALMLRKTSSH